MYRHAVNRSPEPACLAIADVSGYTGYLAGVELDHAQDILADLISTIVEAMAPFRLSKLEGDAAFAFLPGDTVDGSALQDMVEGTYIAFRSRLRNIQQASTCQCNACVRIPVLDLKVVVHQGQVARQQMLGTEELVGPDVILVHRLLKNDVAERTGIQAYALYTQALVDAASIDPASQGLREHREQTDVAGEVVGWVADLDAAWQHKLSQPRLLIPPERLARTLVIESSAPPQVVFEVLTSPSRRPAWDPSIDSIREESASGRRGTSTVNHCMHGKDAIVEEILDWRPPEYWLTRTTVEGVPGSPQFLKSEELERTLGGGTRLEMRIGSVEGRTPADDEVLLSFVDATIERGLEILTGAFEAGADELARATAGTPPAPRGRGRYLSEPFEG